MAFYACSYTGFFAVGPIEEDNKAEDFKELQKIDPFLIYNLLPCKLYVKFKLKGQAYEEVALDIGGTTPFHRFDAEILVGSMDHRGHYP